MTELWRMERQTVVRRRRSSRTRSKMDCVVIWAAAWMFLGGLAELPLTSAGSGHHQIPKDIADLLTDAEKTAIASVDGDPDFIVGVQGLPQPLCFRLEGEPGQVVRLLQDRESGVVVNARLSRPVADVPRTYLSAVLIARRNFRVVAKVGRVLVNRYRFAWGPVSVRRVHGHRVLIAPTLLALTLRNMNVTLVVKRHLPEGRRPSANDTDSRSSPNTASVTPDLTPRHHNATNVVIASRSARRRGGRRRRPDDMEHEPHRRNRRRRRPLDRQRKKQKKRKGGKSSLAKSRSKREKRSEILEFKDLVSLNPKLTETNVGLSSQLSHEKNDDDTDSDSNGQDRDGVRHSLVDSENRHVRDSEKSNRESSKYLYTTDANFSDRDSELLASVRSRRSTSRDSLRSSSSGSNTPRGDTRRTPNRGSRRSRGGSRRSPKRRSRRPPRDGSRNAARDSPRRTARRNSRRSSSNMRLGSSSGGSLTPDGQADDAGRNSSVSGGGDVSSGSGLARDMVAYVGFYVADARDLSPQTHGMLGQFLHKDVTLERVRQKANGVLKARLLVERPRPHHVKATQRTRTNLALNSTTTCWWLRDGGLGVVDGVYTDYLVPRFRATEFLPLPPGLVGQ